MACAIDGTGFALQLNGGQTSISVSLTTTSTNDIIVLYIQATLTGGDIETGSVSDTAGLTWARRGGTLEAGVNMLEEWWAKTPTTLTSDTITISFAHATSFTSVSAFGVSGANFTSPWDTNAGLPFNGQTTSPAFSTTAASTFVIAGLVFSNTAAPTTGTGWTGICTGVANSFMLTEARAFSSAQSNTAVAIGTGSGDEYAWVADALVPASGGTNTLSGAPVFGALATAATVIQPGFCTIDGTGWNAVAGPASITVTLTTLNANDIIVLYIQANLTGGDTQSNSLTDTAGLTWARRGGVLNNGQMLEEWWAKAPGALSSDAITVSFIHAPSFLTMSAFGVAGANFSSPWDTASGLPFSGISGNPVFSTAATSTLAIGGLRFANTIQPTAGTGWSGITSNQPLSFFLSQARAFSSAQTNTTMAVGTGSGDENGWTVDALVPASGGTNTLSGAPVFGSLKASASLTKFIAVSGAPVFGSLKASASISGQNSLIGSAAFGALAATAAINQGFASAPAIDGVGFNLNNNATSISATLETTSANDIIILFIQANLTGGDIETAGVTDNAGLTWARRGGSLNGDLMWEEWWAKSPSPLSSSYTITATFTNPTNFTSLLPFGISGLNYAAPFDTLPGLPFTGISGGPTFSTASDSTFVVGGMRFATTSTPSPGPGWTQVAAGAFLLVQAQQFATVQTNVTMAVGDGAGDENGWTVDVLIPAGTGANVLSGAPTFGALIGSGTISNNVAGAATFGALAVSGSLSQPALITGGGTFGALAASGSISEPSSTLAIDGTGHAANASSSSITVNLTTTSANDIIVLFVQANLTGGDTQTASVTDTAGLSWARRGGNLSGADLMEEWWAQAPNPLTSDTITATFAHTTNFISVSAFGVSGTNFLSPWDTTPGLPLAGFSGDPTFSTTAAATIVIGGLRFQNTVQPTAGTGWIPITSDVPLSFLLSQAKTFLSPQTNATMAVGTGSGDENGWVVDALIAGTGTNNNLSAAPVFGAPAASATITGQGSLSGSATFSASAASASISGNDSLSGAAAFGALAASASIGRFNAITAAPSFGALVTAATISGKGSLSGTGTFGKSAASGSLTKFVAVSGGGTFGRAAASASLSAAITVSGSAAFGAPTASGSLSKFVAVSGSGAFGAPSASASISGANSFTASSTFGAVAASASLSWTMTGAAAFGAPAASAVLLQAGGVFGVGIFGALAASVAAGQTDTATVTATFGALAASANANQSDAVTGAPAFRAVLASASVSGTDTLSGAAAFGAAAASSALTSVNGISGIGLFGAALASGSLTRINVMAGAPSFGALVASASVSGAGTLAGAAVFAGMASAGLISVTNPVSGVPTFGAVAASASVSGTDTLAGNPVFGAAKASASITQIDTLTGAAAFGAALASGELMAPITGTGTGSFGAVSGAGVISFPTFTVFGGGTFGHLSATGQFLPPAVTFQGQAGTDPSITWEVLPTGGIVGLDLASAAPATSWTLTRYVYSAPALTSPTVLIDPPTEPVIYFIDQGEPTNVPLNPENIYVYKFATSAGEVFTDLVTVSGTITLQPDHLSLIMVRAIQAGLQSLITPSSFTQRPTFSYAMPVTTQMRFPMVLLNLELFQQEEIPIGQGLATDYGHNTYSVPAIALRRYMARLYTTTVEEREFYRDAIIAIFNTILTPLFEKIGVNTSHSFQATNGQIVGDQMQPGAFYAEIAMQFSGLYNVAVSTNFPLIESFSIDPV